MLHSHVQRRGLKGSRIFSGEAKRIFVSKHVSLFLMDEVGPVSSPPLSLLFLFFFF